MNRTILFVLSAASAAAAFACSGGADLAGPSVNRQLTASEPPPGNPNQASTNPDQPSGNSNAPATNPDQPAWDPNAPPGGGQTGGGGVLVTQTSCLQICSAVVGPCAAGCESLCSELISAASYCPSEVAQVLACGQRVGLVCTGDNGTRIKAANDGCNDLGDALDACVAAHQPPDMNAFGGFDGGR